MKLRELRKVLQAIVVAGLPAMGCAGDDEIDPTRYPECDETFTDKVRVKASLGPEAAFQLRSCRVDADSCGWVCAKAQELSTEYGRRTGCEVRFFGDDAEVTLLLSTGCPVDGRRPAGLVEVASFAARDRAGAWLAEAAWLEAASIHAFVELARELKERGAPGRLVRAALAAAQDEVRHTEVMTQLALRYGAQPELPVVARSVPRTLEAMAIENAVEGCVRETWGALCALWQSSTAQDPEVRRVYAQIAKDELRHAQLAWAIDAWCAPLLGDAARANVAMARQRAAQQLLEGHDSLAGLPALGVPGPRDARGMLERASSALWQVAIA
jgi:hypothetical protein